MNVAGNDGWEWVHKIYDGRLRRLPNGVFTPGFGDDDGVDKYIHKGFNSEAGAADYSQRYSQHNYFRHHIERALNVWNIKPGSDALMLDIGSGSGNTVLPALQIFPRSRVVASDLSVFLLEILLKATAKENLGRLVAVQENAEQLRFVDATFDYVIGGAILHHLFFPDRALSRVAALLKSGGVAVFFEPCQYGQVLLKMAYERILLDQRANNLEEELLRALRRQIAFIDFRQKHRPDQEVKLFENLEDKWMFSKRYLAEVISQAGFGESLVLPLQTDSDLSQSKVRSQLKLLGLGSPEWLWSVLGEFDANIPQDFMIDNPTGVAILLKK
jgi:ubiquinone/menaquinone biosynthesis C-methylase UbiE